jgi:hypothetical protein
MELTYEKISEYLGTMAAKKELVCYTEMYHYFQIPKHKQTSDENPIPRFLGRMMRDDAKANRPLLASIVVAKRVNVDKSKLLPSQTYFSALGEVRQIPIPKGREKRLRYKAELKAVFAYYAGRH